MKLSDSLVNKNGIDWAKEFSNDVSNNPEISQLAKDNNDVTNQINTLELAKKKNLDDIIAKNPGMSTSLAMSISERQNKTIQDELDGLYIKQNTLSANLNYKTQLAEKMFDYKYQQSTQEAQRQFQVAMQNAQFQQSLYAEDYKNGNINSTNPQIQYKGILSTLQDIYKPYE
jgi:hypothetical protein